VAQGKSAHSLVWQLNQGISKKDSYEALIYFYSSDANLVNFFNFCHFAIGCFSSVDLLNSCFHEHGKCNDYLERREFTGMDRIMGNEYRRLGQAYTNVRQWIVYRDKAGRHLLLLPQKLCGFSGAKSPAP